MEEKKEGENLPAIFKHNRVSKRKKKSKLKQSENAHIITQTLKGVKQIDIAKELNVSRATVSMALKKFAPIFKELENVRDFQSVKADIIDAGLLTTLKSAVDEDKHKEARLGEVAKLLDVLHKASRLERNLSTENRATFVELNPVKTEEPSRLKNPRLISVIIGLLFHNDINTLSSPSHYEMMV